MHKGKKLCGMPWYVKCNKCPSLYELYWNAKHELVRDKKEVCEYANLHKM